jgi:hypothetical protein
MIDLETLLGKAAQLLTLETPPAGELRRLSIELDDVIISTEFQSLNAEKRTQVQKLLQDLRNRIRGGEQAAVPVPNNMPAGRDSGFSPVIARPEEKQHNPYAQQAMEEAEKNFYSGRYSEAIKFYDQVLNIESDWDRAAQHRTEAEGYLRTGHIPAIALPAEAATAFSKAQSAARLGRYQDAMGMLMRSQNILQQFGIQRWQEGTEFEQKLQQNIDAENVYNEGLRLFSEGQLDEGIDKVEAASQVTGLPRYSDRLKILLKEREMIEACSEALNAAILDPKTVTQSKANLDGLILKYGQNPALQRSKTQLEAAIPRVVSPLKEQIQNLRIQANRAQSIEAARKFSRQARQLIDQVRSLGFADAEIDQFQAEVDKTLGDLSRYEDQLEQSKVILDVNRSWPAAAARLSAELRARFPNDPAVIELNRGLGTYNKTIFAMKIGAGIIAGVIIIFLLYLGLKQGKAYMVSLQPTNTPTSTATFTITPTSKPTTTSTPTPKPTNTPTMTATPMIATMARKVWARNGCYEEYTAIQTIPEGGIVHLLPEARRFDSLSRECLLVEYVGESQTIIGWILIADLK